ncbi:MAG: peptidoglycan-binding protein [Clostridia bacterium]|nr:peptidoglycan-binding protein [Clostridia bacterium]
MKRIIIAFLVSVMTVMAVPCFSFASSADGGTDTYKGELPELQNAIATQAIRLAWPYGGYRNYAKPEYQAALSQAYGSRSGWGKKPKAGRSCDVYVGTVVRTSGYDPNFPRALAKDKTYLPASDKFEKVNVTRAADMEPGDLIFYINKGPGGHICVYVEIDDVGYIAEASFTLGRVGRIARKAPNWTPSHFKVFGVYRPCQDCTTTYQEGDKSDEVAKLQEFLTWTGFFKGDVDGVYGPGTTKAVKKFQKRVGIEQTGNLGSETLAAMKSYSNDSAGAKKAK